MNLSIEEAERKINNHIEKKRRDEEEKHRKEKEKLENLMKEIENLEPRITQMIAIANLCCSNGIKLRKRKRRCECLYENDCYETDGIHHQLGFYPEHFGKHPIDGCTHYDYIGYEMGGACGDKDFITDGFTIASIPNNRNKRLSKGKSKPTIRHCSKFLKDFEKFEKSFYDFINNL